MKDRITSGEWKPGQKIPSERDLMRMADISRATVRQAIGSLVHQSLLEKVRGAGTFVKPMKFEQPLNAAYSFSEQLRQLGLEVVDHLLERRLIPATPELAGRLQIAEGAEIIYIRRLRHVEAVPVMVNKAYIPYALCPGLLTEPLTDSLYRTLVARYQLAVVRATDRIEVMHPDRALASLLRISWRVPIIFVERVAMTYNDVVLHVGENYIRGDMCYFRIDLISQASVLAVKNFSRTD